MLRSYSLFLCFGLIALGCRPRSYHNGSDTKAHIVPTIYWPENPRIAVCWENPSADLQAGWDTLKQALTEQYNGRTPIQFEGFGPCKPGMPGIHVFAEDGTPGQDHARPAVVAGERMFGAQLSGVPNAVRMNFTFQNWHPDLCANEPNRTRCVRMYALHEFGHTLGLGEEHLRSDNTCEHPEAKPVQGFPLQMYMTWGTQYDEKSIMNYCMNAKQIETPAELSSGDLAILERLYGKKPELPKGIASYTLETDGGAARLVPKRPEVWSGLLDGASFVALGEPIHGSAIAHLSFTSLAQEAFEKNGFRILSLELPWADMAALDEKIQSGVAFADGEIANHLGSLNSYFLVKFIQWMQERNRTLPQDSRYHLAGFDTQQVVTDFEKLRSLWVDMNLGTREAFDNQVKACHGAVGYASQQEFTGSGADAKNISRQEGDACRQVIRALRTQFEAVRAKVSDWPIVDLMLSSRMSEISKWEKGITANTNAQRDASMAQAFTTLADQKFPGQKQLIWAHYWHVMKATKKIELVNLPPAYSFMNQVDNFGSLMAQKFGSRYRVVGGLAGSYTVKLQGYRTFTVENPELTKPGTLAAFLHNTRQFFVLGDVQAMSTQTETQNVVQTPQKIMHGPNAGVQVRREDVVPGVVPQLQLRSLKDHFDGIFYIFHAF